MDPLTAYVVPKLLGLGNDSGHHFGIDHTGFYSSSALRQRREEFGHALAPGSGVNLPDQICSDIVAEAVNAFGTGWTTRDLFLWLRDVITLGTANGLTFDNNQLRLSWGVVPNLNAPAGVRTLNKISEAFQKLVQNGNYNLACDAVNIGIATARKMDISVEDYSQTEVFNVSVATVNTVPTAVALIQNILANSNILQALRKEPETVLTVKQTSDGTGGARHTTR
ncbi:hypothetical protein V8C35DRAFT_283175 [Trichoderma chlorosporum]